MRDSQVLHAVQLAPSVRRLRVHAPTVAAYHQAGQFVIVRVAEGGERIPLTITESDPDEGWIELVIQRVGRTTAQLVELEAGDTITDVYGPLGRGAEVKDYGSAVVVAGGVGSAICYPRAAALAAAGNHVVSVIGARSSELLTMVDELDSVSEETILVTEDGSVGTQGLVTDALAELLAERRIDHVLVAGPVPMMSAVAELTRPEGIDTVASLNPIMIDGTGMCGGCRVTIGGEARFACVDGPEFDAHDVDFLTLARRNEAYLHQEQAPRQPAVDGIVFSNGAAGPSAGDPCRLEGYEPTELTRKERFALPRQEMPARPGDERVCDFLEVNQGFDADLAIAEADRCLKCPTPRCIDGCPVGVRIDEMIAHIAAGRFDEAAAVLGEDNPLGAVCGRVCPQEAQCEAVCVVGRRGDPVAIGHLERFAADIARAQWHASETPAATRASDPPGGLIEPHRVAIVGSGPAGIACAGDLANWGHDVTMFEALHEPGGVLRYGIPEFRLPREVLEDELAALERRGVRIECNQPIGQSHTLEELLDSYDAVFLGLGAGLPRFLGVPGEHLLGVYSANEFLTRVNLMRAPAPDTETPVPEVEGKHVVVFGGGNTAMDAARTAKRLKAASVTIAYRRTEEEMPARVEEIGHAHEEGIDFRMLTSPTELVGDEGRLREIVLQRMELGEPDEDGRRRPVPIDGAIERIPAEAAVIAVGNSPNPLAERLDGEMQRGRKGTIVVDEATGRTTLEGVWAGGDIVTGGATVILAMGAGRAAAADIQRYLRTGEWEPRNDSAEGDDTVGDTAPAAVTAT